MKTTKKKSPEKSNQNKQLEAKISKLEAQVKKSKSVLDQVKKEQAVYKDVIDNSNIDIWEWKLGDGDIEFSNTYAPMLGYSNGEINKKIKTSKLVNSDDLKEMRIKILEAFRKKESVLDVQFRMKTKFEGWKWIYSKAKIIAGNNNEKSIRVIGTNSNSTVQLQYEEALRGIQNVMHRIVNTVPDVLYVYSMIDESFTYVNEKVNQMLGYLPDDFMNLDKSQVLSLVHPEELPVYKENFAKVKTAGDGEIIETVYRFKNSTGEFRWLNGRCTVFTRGKNKKAEFILGILEDITEKKLAEEALKQSEKQFVKSLLNATELERRRIARELHGGVIHLLMVSNLKLELYIKNNNINSPELNEIKKNVSTAGQEIRSIVNALHSFVLDTYGIIEAISQLVREFNELNSVQLKFEVMGQIDKLDKDIEHSVYRIIQEALLNISKHSKASEASIQVFKRNKSIYISIEDNGAGFEPGDYFSTPPKKASFGLMYMKERSELLSGSFNIDSRPGHGTEIDIEIPLNEKV